MTGSRTQKRCLHSQSESAHWKASSIQGGSRQQAVTPTPFPHKPKARTKGLPTLPGPAFPPKPASHSLGPACTYHKALRQSSDPNTARQAPLNGVSPHSAPPTHTRTHTHCSWSQLPLLPLPQPSGFAPEITGNHSLPSPRLSVPLPLIPRPTFTQFQRGLGKAAHLLIFLPCEELSWLLGSRYRAPKPSLASRLLLRPGPASSLPPAHRREACGVSKAGVEVGRPPFFPHTAHRTKSCDFRLLARNPRG